MSVAVEEVEITAVPRGETTSHINAPTPRRTLDESALHPSGSKAHWVETLRHPSRAEAINLRFPLRVDASVDEDDGGYIVEAPFLGLAGCGESYFDALADLAGSLLFLRADLDGEPDERLTQDAVALRERLRGLFA